MALKNWYQEARDCDNALLTVLCLAEHLATVNVSGRLVNDDLSTQQVHAASTQRSRFTLPDARVCECVDQGSMRWRKGVGIPSATNPPISAASLGV